MNTFQKIIVERFKNIFVNKIMKPKLKQRKEK